MKYIKSIISSIFIIAAVFATVLLCNTENAYAESFSVSAFVSVGNEVTYGQAVTLTAETTGEAAEVTFTWLKNDYSGGWTEAYVGSSVTLKTVAETGNYKCKAVFKDAGGVTLYEALSSAVSVRIVPRTVNLTVLDKVCTYGDKELELNYQTGYGEVLDGDKLNVRLYRDEGSDVGKYVIKADYTSNPNYTLIVTNGEYYINPKTVGAVFSGGSFVYDGTEKSVSATLIGVLGADKVGFTIVGETATEVGSYTAKITSLDNPNYALPEGGITYNYSIGYSELLSDNGEVRAAFEKVLIPDSVFEVLKVADGAFTLPKKSNEIYSFISVLSYNGAAYESGETVLEVFLQNAETYKNLKVYSCANGVLTELAFEADNGAVRFVAPANGTYVIARQAALTSVQIGLIIGAAAVVAVALVAFVFVYIKRKHKKSL